MEDLTAVNNSLNRIISAILFMIALGHFVAPNLRKQPKETDYRRLIVFLFAIWWASLFFAYFVTGFADGSSFVTNGLVMFGTVCLIDLGSVSLLTCAYLLCRAGVMGRPDTVVVSAAYLFSVFWFGLFQSIHDPTSNNAAWRLIAISPSMALAFLSSLALGWAVWVRCGNYSLMFLLVTFIYAILQVPAYFKYMVIAPALGLKENVGSIGDAFDGITYVFTILSLGKIFIGLGFFGYLYSDNCRFTSKSTAAFLPDGGPGKPMNEIYSSILKWGLGILGSLIAGGIGGAKFFADK